MKTTRLVCEVATEVLCVWCGSNQFIPEDDQGIGQYITWRCAGCGEIGASNAPAPGDLATGGVLSERIVEFQE